MMLTKQEQNQLTVHISKTFATKKELKSEINELIIYIDDFKKQTLAAFAEIMHELKAIREELTVGAYHRSNNYDTLGNHEVRIKKLESVSTTT